MSQVKSYIYIAIMLFSMSVFSQKTIENDPEIVQNSINYRIEQAQEQLNNYNYYKAQKNLDEALELAEKADKKSIGKIYAIKGQLQLIIGEEDKAIKSLSKSIEFQRIIDDNINLGKSYKIFGDVYLAKKDYYQALDSYTAAKSKFEEEDLDEDLAEVLLSEGKTYMLLKNYRKARAVIEQALAQSKKIELLKTQSNILINQGIIYNKLGDNEKGLSYAIEGLQIAKENKYTNTLNEGYLVLSNLYNTSENFQLSRNYLNQHLKLSDSIRNLTRLNASKEQETQSKIADINQELEEVSEKLKQSESDNNL